MQSAEGSKRTRLCRLMCGKARPYRSSSTMDFMTLCLRFEAEPLNFLERRLSESPRLSAHQAA